MRARLNGIAAIGVGLGAVLGRGATDAGTGGGFGMLTSGARPFGTTPEAPSAARRAGRLFRSSSIGEGGRYEARDGVAMPPNQQGARHGESS